MAVRDESKRRRADGKRYLADDLEELANELSKICTHENPMERWIKLRIEYKGILNSLSENTRQFFRPLYNDC